MEGVVVRRLARRHPRRDREHRAVPGRDPGLGEPQGEDEHVAAFKHGPDAGEVALAVRFELGLRAEAVRFDLRPERVGRGAVRTPPDLIERSEQAIGAVEQLQQLAHGIDVAEPGGIDPVIPLRAHVLRPRFGDHETIAEPDERAGQMLGETAAGGGDPVVRPDTERRLAHRVHLGPVRGGDRALPERAIG